MEIEECEADDDTNEVQAKIAEVRLEPGLTTVDGEPKPSSAMAQDQVRRRPTATTDAVGPKPETKMKSAPAKDDELLKPRPSPR